MRACLAIAFVSIACGGDDGTATLTADTIVVGKCTFTTHMRIEPDDVFLYVARDGADMYSVVTGVADTADELIDADVRQPISELLPARMVQMTRLEFGGLGEDRSGMADHFVGMQRRTNEIYTSVGTTYGTTQAYPACAFRE